MRNDRRRFMAAAGAAGLASGLGASLPAIAATPTDDHDRYGHMDDLSDADDASDELSGGEPIFSHGPVRAKVAFIRGSDLIDENLEKKVQDRLDAMLSELPGHFHDLKITSPHPQTIILTVLYHELKREA